MSRGRLHKGQFFANRLAIDMADPVLILPDGERISFSKLIVIDDNWAQIQSFKKTEPYFVTANLSFIHLILYTRYKQPKNLHPIFHKGAEGLEEICYALANHMSKAGHWPHADELHDALKMVAASLIKPEVGAFTAESAGPDSAPSSPRSVTPPPPPGRRGSDASIDTASTHGTPG